MLNLRKCVHQSNGIFHALKTSKLDTATRCMILHDQKHLVCRQSMHLPRSFATFRSGYSTGRPLCVLSSLIEYPNKGHRFLHKGDICKKYLHTSNSSVCNQHKTTPLASWKIVDNGRTLVIEQANTGKIQRFNATWLRHNCTCGKCLQPHSGQRLLNPVELQESYTLKCAEQHPEDENQLLLTWHEEDHVGESLLSHLEQNGYSAEDRKQQSIDRIPPVCKGTIPVLQYEDITDSERGLWPWLSKLNDFGVTLVKNVPLDDLMVKQMGEKICSLMTTIYGQMGEKICSLMTTIYGQVFHVVATPEPINIAYSTESIGFHMDLMYYESPPGIQLLFCKEFDSCVEGGESLLVDAWHEAEMLRQLHPQDFDVLTRVPATFQKHHFNREDPVHMTYQKQHIILGHNGQITNINWAPAFEGHLCVDEDDIEPYYRAYKRYAHLLENSETKIELRLQVGDLIAFNNRRMVHGRKQFALNDGSRHLEGCYLNIDEFKSKVEVLAKKYNDGKPAKNVFNQSVV